MNRNLPSSRFLAVILLLIGAGVSPAAALSPDGQQPKPALGYQDTPFLPGDQWRVHDGTRPQPKVVDPGPRLPMGQVPADAVVLFHGGDLSGWSGARGDAQWRLEDDFMEVNGTGSIQTRREFGDLHLHVEWATPEKVVGQGQGRGNSGVFLMGRYEIQVLDCWKNQTYPDGQAAAMYGQYPPAVNVCRPPGAWQSYDIFFEAPRFEGERLVKPAVLTLLHNGVLVHYRREFLGATAHRSVAKYRPHKAKGPIQLQDHGNPVRFRNIWVRPLPGDS
ncbi:MAG: DUF1080 domain-containing protein [Planctomycetota bacterium]|nr:MAG: DUF1080 domain-containing protein [Planctomycetota bacterium]